MEPPSNLPMPIRQLIRYRQVFALLLQVREINEDILDLALGTPVTPLPTETVLEQVQLLEAQIEATIAATDTLLAMALRQVQDLDMSGANPAQ